jgi:antimicrobial peptide system SdpB family protein
MKINTFKITNTFGLARTILALSFLLTLMFNDFNNLSPEIYFREIVLAKKDIFNFFSYFHYSNLFIPKLFSYIILILVISGYYPRYTAIPHAWVSYSLFHTFAIIEGGDQLCYMLCILLIPILIFDNRKSHWQGEVCFSNEKISFALNVFLWLIKIQISFVYLQAFMDKCYIKEWYNGTAVYYWLNHNMFGLQGSIQNFTNSILSNKYICSTITWSVLLSELFVAYALVGGKEIKKVAFYIGLVLHALFFIFLGLPTFMLSMYSALILYLWETDKTFKLNIKHLIYGEATTNI